MSKKFNQFIVFFKYSIWGAVSTIINLVLFVVLKKIGVFYLIANCIAYFIAVFIHYYLNYKFVFNNILEKTFKDISMSFIRFLLIKSVFLIIDSILFYLSVSVLKYNLYFSRIILTGTGIMFTYFFTKKHVYIKESEKIK